MGGIRLIKDLKINDLANICDHTFLKRPEFYFASSPNGGSVNAKEMALKRFLRSIYSSTFQPYAICVRPEDVKTTIEFFESRSKQVRVASVVGFPDGAGYDTKFKMTEATMALRDGASEIDTVLNQKLLRSGRLAGLRNDIQSVVDTAHNNGALAKLILETCDLNSDEIKRVCNIASELDVDFVKTSTGFGKYGAKFKDVLLIRQYFDKGVKISGDVIAKNVKRLLYAASGRTDGYIILDPLMVRIGESKLLV